MLGLLRQDEGETAECVQQLKKDLKSAQVRLDQVKQTPELECGIVANRLYANLGLPRPKHRITPLEAEMAVSSKREEMDGQIQEQENIVENLAEELARFTLMLENHQSQYDRLSGKIAPKQQVVQDSQLGDRNQRYQKLKNLKKCDYTLSPLASCPTYNNHMRTLELRLANPTEQDFQGQAEYQRHLAELKELEAAEKEQKGIVEQLTKDIADIKGELKVARLQLSPLHRKKEIREQLLGDFKTYYDEASTPEASPELSEAQRHQEKIQIALEEHDSRLKEIYQQKDASHKAIENFYTSLAKDAFGSVVDGKVSCKADLIFSLSGTGLQEKTAIKALSSIVADIMAMLSAAEGFSAHPGFLLHDGVRAFELADQLFYKFFNVLAHKTGAPDGSDMPPFQYITTTVSQLEKSLLPFVRAELSDDNLFWKRRLCANFRQGDLLE